MIYLFDHVWVLARLIVRVQVISYSVEVHLRDGSKILSEQRATKADAKTIAKTIVNFINDVYV